LELTLPGQTGEGRSQLIKGKNLCQALSLCKNRPVSQSSNGTPLYGGPVLSPVHQVYGFNSAEAADL